MRISVFSKLMTLAMAMQTLNVVHAETESWSSLRKESARLYMKRDLDGAIKAEERALAVAEQTDASNSMVVKSSHGLASLYRLKGSDADAIRLYRRVVAISDKDAEYPGIDFVLRDLAAAYRETGKPGAAEPLMKRLLFSAEKMHGKDDPAVARELERLSALYKSMGREREARLAAERALAIQTQRP